MTREREQFTNSCVDVNILPGCIAPTIAEKGTLAWHKHIGEIVDNQPIQARTQAAPAALAVFKCGDQCRQIHRYWDDLHPAGQLPSFN
ncbi:MAG: hypothetical protein ABFS30_08010, partial [Pseudomonadota bacterium]